ncbi:unnamed protein product [Brachionus calyciflorus]|uniref:Uncharacterized protein n=1 Tax=Brachionus calyciflorus TaxID=104777 RepID=A0A814NC82_9BILA|nr:unnamed protein product [Brachionus calyciflorus]
MLNSSWDLEMNSSIRDSVEDEFERLSTEFSNFYPDQNLEEFDDVDNNLKTFENLNEIIAPNSQSEILEDSDSDNDQGQEEKN